MVFTDLAATANALRTAAELALNLARADTADCPASGAISSAAESPPVLIKFQEQRFRRLACELPVETRVEIYLCRDADDLLFERLDPHSAVVIGERRPGGGRLGGIPRRRLWPANCAARAMKSCSPV